MSTQSMYGIIKSKKGKKLICKKPTIDLTMWNRLIIEIIREHYMMDTGRHVFKNRTNRIIDGQGIVALITKWQSAQPKNIFMYPGARQIL